MKYGVYGAVRLWKKTPVWRWRWRERVVENVKFAPMWPKLTRRRPICGLIIVPRRVGRCEERVNIRTFAKFASPSTKTFSSELVLLAQPRRSVGEPVDATAADMAVSASQNRDRL